MSSLTELYEAALDFAKRDNDGVPSTRKSAAISKVLFEAEDRGLGLRMLMQQTLSEGTVHRARFLTDALCKSELAWAALPFAKWGITDPASRWQVRRANQVSAAQRPVESFVKPVIVNLSVGPGGLQVAKTDWEGNLENTVSGVSADSLPKTIMQQIGDGSFRYLKDLVILHAGNLSTEMLEGVEKLSKALPLMPVNIVCLGEGRAFATLFGKDHSYPANMHYLMVEEGKALYLGEDSDSMGQLSGDYCRALHACDEASEVATVLNIRHSSEILSHVRQTEHKSRVAEQIFKELGSGSQSLRNPSVLSYAQSILGDVVSQ